MKIAKSAGAMVALLILGSLASPNGLSREAYQLQQDRARMAKFRKDKEKRETALRKKAEEEARKKKQAEKEAERKKREVKQGNFFTRFWIHTVGGPMARGLKDGTKDVYKGLRSGTHKVKEAFMGVGGYDPKKDGKKPAKE